MPELPAVELSDIATGASDSTSTATTHLRSISPRPLSRPPPARPAGVPPTRRARRRCRALLETLRVRKRCELSLGAATGQFDRRRLNPFNCPERDVFALGVDDDGLAGPELLPQDPLGERVLHQALDGPPERPSPEGG